MEEEHLPREDVALAKKLLAFFRSELFLAAYDGIVTYSAVRGRPSPGGLLALRDILLDELFRACKGGAPPQERDERLRNAQDLLERAAVFPLKEAAESRLAQLHGEERSYWVKAHFIRGLPSEKEVRERLEQIEGLRRQAVEAEAVVGNPQAISGHQEVFEALERLYTDTRPTGRQLSLVVIIVVLTFLFGLLVELMADLLRDLLGLS